MKKLILVSTLTLVSFSSHGGSLYSVTVKDLNVNRNTSQVFVRTSVSPSEQTRVSCHEDNNWNFTFIMSTEVDKATFSTLLTAFSANKIVNIVGTNDCTATGYTKVEEVKWVTIRN